MSTEFYLVHTQAYSHTPKDEIFDRLMIPENLIGTRYSKGQGVLGFLWKRSPLDFLGRHSTYRMSKNENDLEIVHTIPTVKLLRVSEILVLDEYKAVYAPEEFLRMVLSYDQDFKLLGEVPHERYK